MPDFTGSVCWTLPQLMWLWEYERENWARVRHILFAKDYLRMRLTDSGGTDITDTIDATGSMFYDVSKGCWSDGNL